MSENDDLDFQLETAIAFTEVVLYNFKVYILRLHSMSFALFQRDK